MADWKNEGLNPNKYLVLRQDGRDTPDEKHHGCEYFVLDLNHDPYARKALAAYAEAVHSTNYEFACDLRAWLMRMEDEHPIQPDEPLPATEPVS